MTQPSPVAPWSSSPPDELERLEIIHPDVAAVLRAKSGMDRLRLAHEAWELARARLAAFLTVRHPELGQEEIRAQVAKRLAHGSS